MRKKLHGISASEGYALGKAYKLVHPDLSFEPYKVNDVNKEIERLEKAIDESKQELQHIRQKVAKEQDEENAKIFDAHLLMINDLDLIQSIKEQITNELVNAEEALVQSMNQYIELFEQMDNEYMKERVADIEDIKKRILSHLLNRPLPDVSLIQEETILIAKDLTPSDTAQVNTNLVKGFVTDIGGRTSHSAIMARTLEISAVVGVEIATESIEHGEEVLIDGIKGEVFVQPSIETKEKYQLLQKKYQQKRQQLKLLKNESTITEDGYELTLGANIGSYEDMEVVLKHGAESIGLYRTEFLYMGRSDFPTEDEQFEAYKAVLTQMEDKPVVIRTIDIGGDKHLNYWKLPDEMNPFLGLRAIRLALDKKDIFRTQLRALLRASVYGNLKIMFPMIATLGEFFEAKQLFLEEKENLLRENIPISNNIEVGIMVEVPSTAVMAPQFAKEVDFFSIGTNDLIQYIFAADRMNQNVSYLYQPFHPAILNIIKMVTDAAHDEGKSVGMCGEMAGEQLAIPLLLGLGLDELSMSPSSILSIRDQLRSIKKSDMELLIEKALQKQTSQEVVQLIHSTFNKSKVIV